MFSDIVNLWKISRHRVQKCINFGSMKRIAVFLLAILAFGERASAQCAMCRATAESVTEHVDKGIGEGLNSGILYLMLVPYVILATLAVVFFRKKWTAWFKTSTIS
jgi:hypothetical protein